MKILAIECSGLVAGIAVTEDDVLLGEYTMNYKKTHSQTILPMLDELAKMIELDLNTIDAIAVSSGPGSFTGCRIGITIAKTYAWALNIPITTITSLEAMALTNDEYDFHVPVLDARREYVFAGIYDADNNQILKNQYIG